MSASDKKKQRKAAMTEEMTQKQRKEAEAAKASKTKKAVYWAVGIICGVAAIGLLIWNNIGNLSNSLHRSATAATVNGTDYSVTDLQYYYGQARQSLLYSNQYFYYYYGFTMYNYDSSVDDGAQWYNEDEGKTYADFFRESALESLQQVVALCDAAKAEGYTLSDAGKASIEQQLSQIDADRAQYGMSRNEYISRVYGDGVTEKVMVKNMTDALLADEYREHHQDSFTYGEEDLKAYYESHPDNLDSFDYRYFYISGSAPSTTDADGNTVAATDEEKEAAKAAAKAKADEAKAEIEAAEDREAAFIEAAPKYVSEGTQNAYLENKDYSLVSGVRGDVLSSSSSVVSSWIKDSERQKGDVTVIESGSTYYVVLFLDRYLVTEPTVDMRHILISAETADDAETNGTGAKVPTQEAMDAAKAKLQSVVDEWKANGATEDAFAALAEEHSDDGRNSDGSLATAGGLYTYVNQGDMIPGIDEWLFEAGRKSGDMEMIQYYDKENGRYFGWHAVYYVQQNEPYWKHAATEAKQETDQSEWLTAITEAVSAVAADGMQYVGSANTATPSAS